MSALLIRASIAQAPPTLVTVAGDIDTATVAGLRRHLLSVPACSTVLDLSGVQLLSAAGLTELVDLRDRLTHADARLALAAAPRLVRRILAITGLDDTMLLADTVDDAVHLVTTPIPPRPRPQSFSAARPAGCTAATTSHGREHLGLPSCRTA
jgi:anti-anti-sigma factor